jgi:tetratricopeptide (TPR) repeat protein
MQRLYNLDYPDRTKGPPADSGTAQSNSDPSATTIGQATAAALLPLSPAERYTLGGEIARGGMGVIYHATDTVLRREVAVKVLQDRFAPDSGTAHRFADEARITGQLQHPAIPPVHDLGTLPDGRPFLAMKLIKGQTLEALLAGRPEPSAEGGRFVAMFEQVCQGLAYAHAHGVIHRDVKPANVMVGAFGEVQVMDWGLAKVLVSREQIRQQPESENAGLTAVVSLRDTDGSETQTGSVLGTPAFMAPEQAAGAVAEIDQRADVFGLGAILTVILTGEPPFRDKTAEAVRLRAARGQVDDAYIRLDQCGADPEMVDLCKRCLSPDRDERPQNAGELAKAISAHLAAVEVRLREAERERAAAEVKAAEQRKRRRWQAAVAAAGMVIFALVGAGAWWVDRQAAEREKERAVAAERDRQEALAALAHAGEALRASDVTAADLALDQAEHRIGESGPSEISTVLTAAKRDRDLVRDLRTIEDMSWAPGYISMSTPAVMGGRYRAVFARYGLDVDSADPVEAAEAVRASQVSGALVSGLSEWFCADPNAPRLRQLLDELDPEPSRIAIRAAIQAGDQARVRTLVKALDGSKVPTWFAASVGFQPLVPQEAGVRLMAAAWRAHPGEYPLAYRSGLRLWGTGAKWQGDMLAWARVAVALRPDSPFANNLLGHAWRALHEWGEAEASIRRAIELGSKYPTYAGPRVNMGNLLLEKGDLDGAEANYRQALAIDPDATGIYYNMGLVHQRRGDLAKAEEWCRKAVATPQPNETYRKTLEAVIQVRAKLARLDELATTRTPPATPAEAIDLAEVAYESPRRRYVTAVSLYKWAFAVHPAFADDLKKGYRYSAACLAVRSAAGEDEEMTTLGVEEWGYLTGLALKWLRADLAERASRARNPQRRQEMRDALTHWKVDADLAPVRDQASLEALAPSDRKAWEALWRDVDAVLASITGQPGIRATNR